MSKKYTVKVNRSAKDGQFVDKQEAKENPDTTVTEKVQKTKLVKDGLDPLDYTKVLWKEVPVDEDEKKPTQIIALTGKGDTNHG